MNARIASAIVGLPILLGAVWLGSPWFSAFIFIVALIAAAELTRLVNMWNDSKCHIGFSLIFTAFFILNGHNKASGSHIPGGPSFGFISPDFYQTYTEVVLAIMLPMVTNSIVRDRKGDWSSAGFLMGIRIAIYAGGFLWYALRLRGLEQGFEWTLVVLIGVMATDTAAYFAGRAFGKTPLAPKISPAKTWEGAAAGFLAAMLATGMATLMLDLRVIIWEALILGALIGSLSQLGDLAESRIKRRAGVKDSGWLIPGHGGMLDRIDSIVFTLPAVYYFVIWEVQRQGLLS